MRDYRIEDLERWAAAVLERRAVPTADARTVAYLLVRSDLRGYRTHGLARLATYVERLADGSFNPKPQMRRDVRDGVIVFEADGAMGHVVGPAVVEAGVAELGRRGSVFVAVRECGHLGALGIHALLAAEAGVFCLVGQRTPPRLALPGFRGPSIGHNPLAFACPVAVGDPIVFDAAASVAARGHILLAARENRPIPEGWALDEQFQPTTDARSALKGYLLPMGGHKGMGLAMMVECLAGAFTAVTAQTPRDAREAPETGAGGREGAFFLFLDPGAFGSREAFDGYMAQWTGTYLDAGAGRARLPGERGARRERELRSRGLDVPPGIEDELRRLGERIGVPFDLAAGG